jgi:hypothetical protein
VQRVALLDGEAVAHQGPMVRLGQRHPFPQLAAQNLFLLPEEIVLLGQVLANENLVVSTATVAIQHRKSKPAQVVGLTRVKLEAGVGIEPTDRSFAVSCNLLMELEIGFSRASA